MRTRHSAAFTLVELMVVVSIIALLMAVLLPALSRARGAAMTTKSTTQVRQIALALFIYANDNNDSLPYRRQNNAGDPSGGTRWQQKLTVPGYISDGLVFWGPFRDTSWLDFYGPSHGTYKHLLKNSPGDPSLTIPLDRGGYSINALGNGRGLAADWHNTSSSEPYAEYRSHRLGGRIVANQSYVDAGYARHDPPPSEVILLGEQARDGDPYGPNGAPVTGSGDLSSPAGKIKDMGTSQLVDTNSPIFTPEGRATRAYLDGHAASREASDLHWIATSPVTGKWAVASGQIRHRSPWYSSSER